MPIQRYSDGFTDQEPTSFSSMLDRFFSDSLASRGRVSRFSPQADAYETEKSYEIEVALPGMKREDVQIEFQRGRLTIKGERHFRNEQNERRYHMVESSFGSFARAFQFGEDVDPRQIKARFEDGVLRVSVPKDEQKTMRHRIEIGEQTEAGQSNQTAARKSVSQGKTQGQMSQRLGQGATDIPVETADSHNGHSSQQPGKKS